MGAVPVARSAGALSATALSAALLSAAVALGVAACGSGGATGTHRHAGRGIPPSLAAAARPIGAGPRFHPSVRGPGPDRCLPTLHRRYGVHVELFAADRVVLVAPGIGVGRPWHLVGARIASARCYGSLVTLDPTGVVLVRPGSRDTVGELFRDWGRPLGARRLLSFRSGGRVRAYVDGRRWTRTAPAAIPLTRHAEIVLELGPYVPPHRSFTFPRGE